MKLLRRITFLLLAVTLTACCACRSSQKHAKPLTQTKWSLVQMEGQPIVTDNNYYLTLGTEADRFSARGDCNMLMGSFTAEKDGKLQIRGGASSMAFCPNQEQESKFFALLNTIDSYSIDGSILMLTGNGELLLVFEAK